MISISGADVIEYNESINESDWWYKDELLDSCFSSYYYYDNELEQISSIFRGLAKKSRIRVYDSSYFYYI